MVKLAQIQEALCQGILSGEAPNNIDQWISSGNLGAHNRFQIHQNNFRQSLIGALEGVFPLCCAFVGNVFIREALRRFVLKMPPQEAVLSEYGSEFSGFLREFTPVEETPYLPDIAALEWKTHEMLNKDEMPVHSELANDEIVAGKTRICFSPNAELIESEFPIFSLWQAATGQVEPEEIEVDQNPQNILLVLSEGQVFYQDLPLAMVEIIQNVREKGDDKGIRAELRASLKELVDRGALTVT